MSFAVQRIDHVEVFVRDLEQAAKWYADALGLREVRRWDPHPIMIGADDTKLALFQAKPEAQPLTREQTHGTLCWYRVAFKTDRAGFENAKKHLAEQGIEFSGPIDHVGAQSIYFEDLDGHPLEITYYY